MIMKILTKKEEGYDQDEYHNSSLNFLTSSTEIFSVNNRFTCGNGQRTGNTTTTFGQLASETYSSGYLFDQYESITLPLAQ